MCRPVVHHGETNLVAGALLELCPEFAQCLVTRLKVEDSSDQGTAKRVFDALQPAVQSAVVENDYFDLDYRSEFGALHETVFSVRTPVVQRVHFFSNKPAPGQELRAFVLEAQEEDAYLGYIIVRPQEPRTLGRCVFSPSGRVRALKKPETIARHVRTLVVEYVELFGVRLQVVGTPFMEQDGHLLRCAHVAAWVCHYSAVLRGIVNRRPTAVFHSVEDDFGAYGRQYPSEGLTSQATSRVLRALDLPPEVIDDVTLRTEREVLWSDRPALIEALDAADSGEPTRQLWIEENLTSSVCRYLNSGFPCILSSDEQEHAVVVCGYVRNEDLNGEWPTPGAVKAFVVSDDGEGPFRLLPIHEIMSTEAPSTKKKSIRISDLTILVPLPRGLWLSGQAAEAMGATMLKRFVQERSKVLEFQLHDTCGKVALNKLAEDIEVSGRLAIRSFAIGGSDFKIGFATRLRHDSTATKVCAYTRLPKYVWVVEIHDRALRAEDKPSVLGTIVLDASTTSDGSHLRSIIPLLVHLPGQVAALRGPTPFANEKWVETEATRPYETGRWSNLWSELVDSRGIFARAKMAN